MSVTLSEWHLLRALAWHRVMMVRRGGDAARQALMLKRRNLISTIRHDEGLAIIRITDAGVMEAAKIEKELCDVYRV